jgi:transposase
MEVPALNKFEKRDLVIKLHEEGKTYSEIAHIAHVSIRDIKPILKKYERKLQSEIKRRDNEDKPVKKISKSSRAYQILLEGKTPVQAIELNLGFEETRKYWMEFLRLQRMKKLYNLYVDNECHLD